MYGTCVVGPKHAQLILAWLSRVIHAPHALRKYFISGWVVRNFGGTYKGLGAIQAVQICSMDHGNY